MAVETNNPTVVEPVVVQEPSESQGLEEAAEVTVEGTGTEAVQPEADTATEKVEKAQAKGVDLNKAIAKLSPAEQKAYKAFQADYTKKSQSAAKVTEYENYLNNLVTDPEISAILKARQEKAKVEAEPDFSKMTDEQIFNYTVRKEAKVVASEETKELRQQLAELMGDRQRTLVEQGNKIIDDFATNKKLDVEDVRELAKYAVGHNVSLDEAYKVAYFDKIPEAARQEALDDLDLKKKANLELGNVPSGVAPIMPEKPTVRQAFEMAQKQLGIKE
ncbi:MAG: hypothetical protein ABIK92_05030 [Pseudomonadota bacterium]